MRVGHAADRGAAVAASARPGANRRAAGCRLRQLIHLPASQPAWASHPGGSNVNALVGHRMTPLVGGITRALLAAPCTMPDRRSEVEIHLAARSFNRDQDEPRTCLPRAPVVGRFVSGPSALADLRPARCARRQRLAVRRGAANGS
jgi:hypothetical protein